MIAVVHAVIQEYVLDVSCKIETCSCGRCSAKSNRFLLHFLQYLLKEFESINKLFLSA